MQITTREFLRRLGLGGAGLVGGAALADEFVATNKKLPPGAIGDPEVELPVSMKPTAASKTAPPTAV